MAVSRLRDQVHGARLVKAVRALPMAATGYHRAMVIRASLVRGPLVCCLLAGASVLASAADGGGSVPATPTPTPATIPPTAVVAKDGLPTGQDSAEGVACDLARAFAAADAAMWSGITVKLPSDDQARAKLEAFVGKTAAEMDTEAAKPEAERSGPKEIDTCFKARHLSDTNAAAYGATLYHYQDVMFVDVVVKGHDGQESANRTLVVKAADGKWYVHPQPSLSPMLSMGLNGESDSEQEVVRKPSPATAP